MQLEATGMPLAVTVIAVGTAQDLVVRLQPPDARSPRPRHVHQAFGQGRRQLAGALGDLVRDGGIGRALPRQVPSALCHHLNGAVGAQPLPHQQEGEADHRQHDEQRHRQRGPVVAGDKADEIVFGNDDQDPPVAAGAGQWRRGRNVAHVLVLEDPSALSFDPEAIESGCQHRIAELIHLRRHELVPDGFDELLRVRHRDHLARVVHDQGAPIDADLQRREES